MKTLEKRLLELDKTYKRIEKSMEETETLYKNIINYDKVSYDDSKVMKAKTEMWKRLHACYENYLNN